MNRFKVGVAMLGAIAVVVLAGCQSESKSLRSNFERPDDVGWLAAVSSADTNAMIAEDQLLTTVYKKGFLGIGWDKKWEVLIGADPVNATGPAKAYLKKEDGHFKMYVETGFAYMDGNQPYGTGAGGSTSSEGSVMLIQAGLSSQTGTPMARFYFLEGSSMTVVSGPTADPGNTVKTETVGQYITVVENQVPSDAADIPSDPVDPIRKFVDEVLDLAANAGFNVPTW